MEFRYQTIMTWMKYLETGLWKIESKAIIIEQEIVERFTELFRNELVREAINDFSVNPYSGIPYMSLTLSEDKTRYFINDQYGFLTQIYEGIFGSIKGRKLCLNIHQKGFSSEYFKYLDKEDDNYVFIEKIIKPGFETITPNIERFINIIFARRQPVFEVFNRRKIQFREYSETERKQILKDAHEHD